MRELWENTREGLEGVGDWIDEWMPKPVQRIIKDYVLPNTPIIGTILDVRDWAQAYCYGDDTDLALATMGIVPFGDFFKPLSKVLKKLNIPKIHVPGGGVPHAPAIVPSHVPKAKTPGTPGKPASPTIVPAKPKREAQWTEERKTRPMPGRDGGTSTHIIERRDGEINSVTHQVSNGGKVIHQHQTHIGKHGTERRFPDEWVQYPRVQE